MEVRWLVLGTLVAGCSTMTPAQRTQQNYQDARLACVFQHQDDEAKEKADRGTSTAADNVFYACLEKARTERERELASAKPAQE